MSALLPLLGSLLLRAPSDPPRALAAAVEERVSPVEANGASVGIEVRSLDRGETLVSRRARILFSAASNTKIVTTAAAPTLLPPDFHFETPFSIRGDVKGGALHGDLLVSGGGDPCLSGRFFEGGASRAFAPVAKALKEAGIDRIEGDVVLDDRLFDGERVHPGWPRDQLSAAYCAKVSALPLNEGCVVATVTPGRPGEAASIEISPLGCSFAMEGKVATVPGRGKTVVDLSFPGPDRLRIRGEIAASSAPYKAEASVPDPLAFFGAVLASALRSGGVELAGPVRPVREGEEPLEGARVLHVIRSPLLPAVVVIDKQSENFSAEHLMKLLGARFGGEGSWTGGVRAVRGFLGSSGIPAEGFEMEDGSGLSRGNRFSPAFLVAVLESMWKGPRRDDFFRSLPSAGEPGTTLDDRLREEPYRRSVRAKTGYILRVSALSGYARTRAGETLAFSILVNDRERTANRVFKAMQDDVVRLLVDYSRNGG